MFWALFPSTIPFNEHFQQLHRTALAEPLAFASFMAILSF
jgi:hypothetical protein